MQFIFCSRAVAAAAEREAEGKGETIRRLINSVHNNDGGVVVGSRAPVEVDLLHRSSSGNGSVGRNELDEDGGGGDDDDDVDGEKARHTEEEID